MGRVAPALDGLSQARKGADIVACRHDGRPHLALGHELDLIAPAGAALPTGRVTKKQTLF